MNRLPKQQLLCYGDSNTWGYIPQNGSRYPLSVRWPGVLHQKLGNDFFLIENAVRGRSAHDLMPQEDERNGHEQLLLFLSQHPVPAITVIMLGTNDMLFASHLSTRAIAQQLIKLAQLIQHKSIACDSDSSNVVLISPPPFHPTLEPGYEYQHQIKKSQDLAGYLLEMAIQADIPFINAGDVTQGSMQDGLHLNAEDHIKLGSFLYDELRRLSIIA
ncbi:MAG: GDSL-type esterase/lipase family protein [Bacteroidales bacterium]